MLHFSSGRRMHVIEIMFTTFIYIIFLLSISFILLEITYKINIFYSFIILPFLREFYDISK